MRRVAVALATAVAACGVCDACDARPSTPPPAQDAAVMPPRMRGTLLVRDDSTLRFVACGTVTERALIAPPASQLRTAIAAVNGAVRDSLFVEFIADSARGPFTVRETLFATSVAGGSRCDRPPVPFEIVATGNEPFWRVTFDGTQLMLERPEPPRELVFDADPAIARGNLTTILGRRSLGGMHHLTLGVLRESCRDGMSDSWYPYRAEVRADGIALHGCARR